MEFRHEWKYEISTSDMYTIRSRLGAVAYADKNAINGIYTVRSLYFDDFKDTALREKINGVNRREKFRIRYYNGDTSFIKLEKKSKINGLCNKVSETIKAEEVNALLNGDITWMNNNERPLVFELYVKMKNRTLLPKTIVEYTREPFVFSAGNVRVTIDYNIRTGIDCTEFLSSECVTVPAGNSPIILEVKWDEFLPNIIKDSVSLEDRRSTAFSKYAQCRIYG
ncbi:MAG: polyphosphate polymerase domain-containing protein [Acutalibacteraceae bacterium]